jgi:uncharacterized membrane protein (DUF4010 family)
VATPMSVDVSLFNIVFFLGPILPLKGHDFIGNSNVVPKCLREVLIAAISIVKEVNAPN